MPHCKDKDGALLPDAPNIVDTILLTWQFISGQSSITQIQSLQLFNILEIIFQYFCDIFTSVRTQIGFLNTKNEWDKTGELCYRISRPHYSVTEQATSLAEQIYPDCLQIHGTLLLKEPHSSSMAPPNSILFFLWSIHSFMPWPQLPPILIRLPGIIPLDTFHLPKSHCKLPFLVHIPLLIEEKQKEDDLQNRQHITLPVWHNDQPAGWYSQLPGQPKRGKKAELPHSFPFHLFPASTFI